MATINPEALLERLCREPKESEWLEFKVDNGDPRVIGERIAACANAAILAGKDRAFLVFGVEDGTRKKVGTKVRLSETKNGGEPIANWLSRVVEPRLMIEFLDFEVGGKHFAIIAVEPTYERPVRFSGTEYIRVGEHTKKLKDLPEHERALWLATSRRKFENAVALSHQTRDRVFQLLDVACYYRLAGQPQPTSDEEVIRRFCEEGFLIDDMEGSYDITNLGAVLFAQDITQFPSIAGKSVRVIQYSGRDKSKSVGEIEGRKGYAVGFAGLLSYVTEKLPKDEQYIRGVRSMVPIYPETAIREVIANALIHQDFTIHGASPIVEIYSDRLEITNPGTSLIELDRLIDERRSRNEKLASTMRFLGLCEERGGGLDKAVLEIERMNLPAPAFHASEHSMRVALFGPKEFSKLTKQEKLRACFYHCVIRWIMNDFMSNSTLRDRFGLTQQEYQAASAIISESVKAGRIVPAEPDQGRRNARYVPYWARSE